MSGLLDLPPELVTEVLEILQATIPDSFENLALSCKRLYLLSDRLRYRHTTLRKRYRNVVLDRSPRSGGIVNINQLVHEIAIDPLAAIHIQTADLGVDEPGLTDETRELISRSGQQQEDLIASLQAVNSQYFEEAKQEISTWITDMAGEQEETDDPEECMSPITFIFLLTLLPNLRKLIVPKSFPPDSMYHRNYAEPYEGEERMYDALVRRANIAFQARQTSTGEFREAPLSRLETVVRRADVGYDRHNYLSPFKPFLALESLQKFKGTSLITLNDRITRCPWIPRYEDTLAINLSTLELIGGFIGGSELSSVLSSCTQLKRFRLHYETKLYGITHAPNCGAIGAALVASPAAATLEVVEIIDLDGYMKIVSALPSFKPLVNLKELCVDVRCLTGKATWVDYSAWAAEIDCAAKASAAEDDPRPADMEGDFSSKWEGGFTAMPIHYFLPDAIEKATFRLYADPGVEDIAYREIFAPQVTLKGHSPSPDIRGIFPKLRQLQLYMDNPPPDDHEDTEIERRRLVLDSFKALGGEVVPFGDETNDGEEPNSDEEEPISDEYEAVARPNFSSAPREKLKKEYLLFI